MIERPMDLRYVQVPPARSGMTFQGHEMRFDDSLVIRSEDWSGVRSPGRARRRLMLGHKQRIIRTATPNRKVFRYEGHGLMPTMIMHPAMWTETVLKIAAETDFYQRASRARLDVDRAVLVRNAWRKHGESLKDILWRAGEVKVSIPHQYSPMENIFLPPFGAPPRPVTPDYEIVRLEVMSDGVLCVCWHDLIIEEGFQP